MTRLYAYNIAGQPVGTVVQTWDNADLLGDAPFVLSDTPVSGYTDITTISNIATFGHNCDADFKRVRDVMKKVVVNAGNALIVATVNDPTTITPTSGQVYLVGTSPIGDFAGKAGQTATWTSSWAFSEGDGYAGPIEELGFSTMTPTEKNIAATNLIGTVMQQIMSFPTQLEKTAAQAQYKTRVQDCRGDRYKYAENYFLQMIPANAGQALGVILSNGLHFMYRDQGIDGTNYGDPVPGIADWVYGTGPFAGGGLKDMPWSTVYGETMTSFASYIGDKLFNIGLSNEELKSVS